MPLEIFHVPRQVFSPKAGLGPYERLFLATLCSFWERREDLGAKTFQASNYELRDASGISWRTIPAVSRRLVEKGFISAVQGYAGRTTEYAIRWDRIAAIDATRQ